MRRYQERPQVAEVDPVVQTGEQHDVQTGKQLVVQTGDDIPLSGYPLKEPLKDISAISYPSGRKTAISNQSGSESAFDVFWQVYPKRVGKFEAAKAYGKVLKSGLATADVLLAAATRFAAGRAGEDPRFTKHPATWLNQGCWMDEPQPPSGLAKQGSVYAGLRSFVGDGSRGQ